MTCIEFSLSLIENVTNEKVEEMNDKCPADFTITEEENIEINEEENREIELLMEINTEADIKEGKYMYINDETHVTVTGKYM